MPRTPTPRAPSRRTQQAAGYRIAAVSKLTGISPHVLRIWERRYGVVAPARSQGGGRMYSLKDVEVLRALKQLVDAGRPIGTVAQLSPDALARLAAPAQPVEAGDAQGGLARRFLAAVAAMDTQEAQRVLGRVALAAEDTGMLTEVLVPLLHEVGARWEAQAFSIAQEHAATALLRTFLGMTLQQVSSSARGSTAVCATAPGERHEFGALMAAVVAGTCGWRAVYLGADLPTAELADAARVSRAAAVMLSGVAVPKRALRTVVKDLRRKLPPQTGLVVGGHAAEGLKLEQRGVTVVDDLVQLRGLLLSMRT